MNNSMDSKKKGKKELLEGNIVSKTKIEEDGLELFRARYSERETFKMNPKDLEGELDEDDFFKCLNVNLTEAKNYLPESTYKKLITSKGVTSQVSFQKKG